MIQCLWRFSGDRDVPSRPLPPPSVHHLKGLYLQSLLLRSREKQSSHGTPAVVRGEGFLGLFRRVLFPSQHPWRYGLNLQLDKISKQNSEPAPEA